MTTIGLHYFKVIFLHYFKVVIEMNVALLAMNFHLLFSTFDVHLSSSII